MKEPVDDLIAAAKSMEQAATKARLQVEIEKLKQEIERWEKLGKKPPDNLRQELEAKRHELETLRIRQGAELPESRRWWQFWSRRE
jgi:predicted ATP-grasp superfamily ATP-dependent carboligase